MKKYFFAKIVFVLFIFSSIEVSAWGLTGHRVIAEIANHHLTHRTQRKLHKLFNNQDIVYWANWPDFIKSDKTGVWRSTFAWHYVNISKSADFIAFKKELEAQPKPNLYSQIQALIRQVKNKNTSDKDRRIAIIFLVHLVGDMAQPMHLGRADDLGGNRIDLTFFGRKTNLHRLWDSNLIDSQKYSYSEYARLLDTLSRKEVKQIQSGSLAQWCYESHLLANDIYAHTPEGARLGYDYEYKYINAMEQQLLKGGLRLAKILNSLF